MIVVVEIMNLYLKNDIPLLLLATPIYILIAKGKSCKDHYFQIKSPTSTVDGCAMECRNESSVFSFGCGVDHCKCYCIAGATTAGTCNKYYDNSFYDLFKYTHSVQG